jgi:hypothetical protein
MGRDALMSELTVLRKFYDDFVHVVRAEMNTCECDSCICTQLSQSCKNRCLDCEEKCDERVPEEDRRQAV